MTILVATNHLNSIGGTESYTYYLIKELNRQGYDVEYYTLNKGLVSKKIESEIGVKEMSKSKYDLILANHNSTIKKLWRKGFIIQTCHGVFPYLEKPSTLADAYVSISDEVQEFLASKQLPSYLILNGIDCGSYYPANEINEIPKNLLSLCQSDVANQKLQDACTQLDINFISYKQFGKKIWNINKTINEVDIVVGLGRSAYDAMACGRPVIIYDERPYMDAAADGYIVPILTESLSKNCSGRFYKKQFEVKDLVAEIKKYKKEDGIYLRNFAINYLNIERSVSLYLNIYNTNKNISTKKRIIRSLGSFNIGKSLLNIFKKTIYA